MAMTPKKILFLPRWYPSENDPQNGVFIQKHARAAARHHSVTVIYAEPSSKIHVTENAPESNLREVIYYYKKSSFKLLNLLRYFKTLFRAYRELLRGNFVPDLCHVHMLTRPVALALWLKWKHGIPYLITEHWSGYLTGKFQQENYFKKRLTAHAIKNAAMVTVVSEFLKKGMIQCGLNAKFQILPNVVETNAEGIVEKAPEGKFSYLVVADLNDAVKNISGIIKAFSRVYQKEPATELRIAGDGNDRAQLEQLAKQLQLETACHFLGRKTNDAILKLIPQAHVLIVNSRVETFSVVTLEAIFSGRPVIATRCGGPEAFINADNGILIGSNDEEGLAAAMLNIKKDYANYPPEKVSRSVENIYSLNTVADSLQKIYKEVLKIA